MSIHFAAHLLEIVCTVNTLASHLYKNTLSVITIRMPQMLYIDIRFLMDNSWKDSDIWIIDQTE